MRLPKVKKHDRGYYLRVWRAERDLSIGQAAEVFGVSPSFWSLLEDGRRNASPKVAAELANATGQPIEIFLGIEVTR